MIMNVGHEKTIQRKYNFKFLTYSYQERWECSSGYLFIFWTWL